MRIKTEFTIVLILGFVLLCFQGVICYRQTQLQKAMLQVCDSIGRMKIDSDINVQAYYDIMRALDIQKKTGEISIRLDDESRENETETTLENTQENQ